MENVSGKQTKLERPRLLLPYLKDPTSPLVWLRLWGSIPGAALLAGETLSCRSKVQDMADTF